MGSITFNQVAGAALGALLVFLLLGFGSDLIYHGVGGHGDDEVLAFALDTGDEDAAQPAEDAPAEVSLAALVAEADIDAGATVYNQCKACHKIEDGANGVGPHLWGVVGREIAAVDGFAYSDALKAKDGVWDLETLSAWLENPADWAPGTTMGYAGLADAADRVNVVAYMNAQGDDPVDLAAMAPEAPVEAEAEAEAETAAAETTVADDTAAAESTETAAAEAGGSYDALLANASAENGETVFNQCKACHKIEDGVNGVGPHLWGVVGREIAAVEDYSYSDSLAGMDGVWDLDTLMAWLEDPNKFAPGNKMMMAYPDAQDRIDVITYMNEADGTPIDLGAAPGEADTEAAAAMPAEGAEETETAAADPAGDSEAAAGEDGAQDTAAPEEQAAAGGSAYADLLAQADAEAGKKVFNQCRACHKVEDGANGVGPHLHAVVGREIASVDAYSYSDALASMDGVWDLETLMAWLENPNKFAAGNKMMMAYPDAQDRINVITWLNEVNGDPQPLE